MIKHWISKKEFGHCSLCLHEALRVLKKLGKYSIHDDDSFEKAYYYFSRSPELVASHIYGWSDDDAGHVVTQCHGLKQRNRSGES